MRLRTPRREPMHSTDNRRAYLFQVVEVGLQPGHPLTQKEPAAQGAYVNCVVAAGSVEDAKAALLQALAEDQYIFVDFQQSIDLGSRDQWLHPDMPEQVLEMAIEALEKDDVVYGGFAYWSQTP